MTQNVLVLKHFESPKEGGVHHRLMCLTGKNKGQAYILKGNRAVLGRGENVDIKVYDIKSSREHAEITKVGVDYILTDLGSQNGVYVNESLAKQVKLHDGDRVVIGQTVYKFGKIEVKENINIARREEVKTATSKKNQTKKKGASPLLILVILAGVFVMLYDSPKETIVTESRKRAKVKDISDDFVSALRKREIEEDQKIKKKLNSIFQRGLREYREENYFRALNEFNLALILNPKDPLAEFYLRKTKNELDNVIADYFVKGKRDEDALKYQSAIVTYCAVIRLLGNYPDDERYKNAVKQINELENLLGMEQGETSCLQTQSKDK